MVWKNVMLIVPNTPNCLQPVIYVEQFLAMVEESEKAEVRDYTNLVVTDSMLEYVYEKYGSNWTYTDEIANVILEDLWLKYRKG